MYLSQLELAQTAATMLLTGTQRRDHITPVLTSLHCLPVQFRVDLKVLLFVYTALNGLTNSGTADPPTPLTTSKSIRLADLGLPAILQQNLS